MQFLLAFLIPVFAFATQKPPTYYSGANRLKFDGTTIIDKNDTQISPSTIDGLTPTTTKGDLLVEGTSALERFPVCGQDLVLSGSSATSTGWDCATAGVGGLDNLVEDLSPELGGNLVLNSKDITGTGDINHTGTLTTSGNVTVSTLTASRAVISDGSKVLSSSATTSTELGYVNGVTSAIQTQLDTKITATLTDEQVEDIAGAMMTGTETGITVTYQDGTADADYILDSQNIHPGSQTNNTLLRADGTTGLMQGSGIVVDDSDNMSSIGTIGSGAITADSISLTTDLALSDGGTGQNTKQAAMDGLSPTATKGDLLVDDGSNVVSFPVCGQDLILSGSSATATGWDCTTASGSGDVSAAANMNNNSLVRGDGGSKGVQDSDGSTLDDNDNMDLSGTLVLDNDSDSIVMTVQGHSTQTTGLLLLEQSDGTDVMTVSNAGAVVALSLALTTNLALGDGGTGQGTKQAAMDGLSPTATKGDLLVDDGANVITFPVCGQDLVLSGSSATSTGWDCATSGGGTASVVSNQNVRTCSAAIDMAGTVTVIEEDECILSIDDTATGKVNVNVDANVFSVKPHCVCSAVIKTSEGNICGYIFSTSDVDDLKFEVWEANGLDFNDEDFNFVCVGIQ